MSRIVRGVGALLGLLLGLVGVPVALVLLGSDVWPNTWAGGPIVRVLLQPDDGRLLLVLLTVIGWLGWLVFAMSVLAEAVGLVSHRRFRLRLPGLAAPQRLAAALLIAVIALVPTAPVAQADPSPAQPTPDGSSASHVPVTVGESVRTTPPSADPTPAADPSAPVATNHAAQAARAPESRHSPLVHTVKPGDDLWSLAEQYYGDGMEWRKIARANRHVLSGGPDRLDVGWELTIPGAATKSAANQTTTVRRGDTLSSIAERELGSASHWPELFRANRALLEDPDELAVGITLAIPGPDAESATAKSHAGDQKRTRDGATRGSKAVAPPTKPAPHDTSPGEPAGSEARAGSDEPAGSEARAESDAPAGSDKRAGSDEPAGSDERSGSKLRRSTDKEPTGQIDRPDRSPTRPTAASSTASTPTASAADPPTTAGAEATTTSQAIPISVPVGAPESADSPTDLAASRLAAFAGVSGLLAAGLLGGLAYRRRLQLHARPVGRRIMQPDAAASEAEVALGASQRPLDLQAVDTTVRAIGVHCRRTAQPVPRLTLVSFDAESIDLTVSGPLDDAPLGFTRNVDGWSVTPSDALYLGSVPGVGEAIRPYPTLVGLGSDGRSRNVLVNLEELGLLSLTGDRRRAEGLLAAMTVELAFAPWADEMILTVVGDRAGLPEALDKHNVTTTEDVDTLLDHLEGRARAQREQWPDGPAGHYRIDPDLSDPWAPEVVLISRPLDPEQQHRFVTLVAHEPRPTVAIVVVGDMVRAPWILRLGPTDAVLEPVDLRLTPQQLPGTAEDAVVSLVAATGSLDTAPAPWWAHDTEPPDPPPDTSDGDNIAYLARRSAGWATGSDDENGQKMAQNPVIGRDNPPDHPVLLLLGPIDLVGARGQLPPRAAKQCLEYCGWLLEHPGTTAQAMGSALLVAEGTRRSNMSRLRTWLGADEDGQAYLPDAYTGRILLHAAVSSDWQRLQILTAAGVNRTSDNGLRSALELVRGAPLADAAPGQWHWAEELRTDMSSAVRDIGVELAGRANDAGDLEVARWAAARALAAAPGDELLLAARIRTEHLAGNRADTERLTLQLAAQSRSLGVDLDPETVELLQQVMEGQVRARMA